MAPTKSTLRTHQEKNCDDMTDDCKFLAGNATTRNIVDLLLVITILVLLGIAAPIIRGDHCGKFVRIVICSKQTELRMPHCQTNFVSVYHCGLKGFV